MRPTCGSTALRRRRSSWWVFPSGKRSDLEKHRLGTKTNNRAFTNVCCWSATKVAGWFSAPMKSTAFTVTISRKSGRFPPRSPKPPRPTRKECWLGGTNPWVFWTIETAANLTEAELLEFLFLPGFTMKDSVTEISGRGVGLDVVQSMVKRVRGSVRVSTQPGQGTRFQLQLPLTLSILRALLVEIGGEPTPSRSLRFSGR